MDKAEYRKNIRRLVSIFEGKKNRVIRELEREMEKASKELEFEKAVKLRKQIFVLRHIQDVALLHNDEPKTFNLQPKTYVRIEGYDVSNISGTAAVGVMVVFSAKNGADFASEKNEYRKFRIHTITKSDDVGMLNEVLRRRFRRIPPAVGWPLPDAILVDGGRGQVSAARAVLDEFALRIPVVGIAKGPARKNNKFVGAIPCGMSAAALIRVRDEAHRFAIAYHRRMRAKSFLDCSAR